MNKQTNHETWKILSQNTRASIVPMMSVPAQIHTNDSLLLPVWRTHGRATNQPLARFLDMKRGEIE